MRSSTRAAVVALVLLSGLLPPGLAAARPRSALTEFGLGTASAALSMVYGPAKFLYALGGSVTGGLAWIFTGGRADVARSIVQPALRGDYVVVPENLTGDKPLTFVGRDPRSEPYPY